MANIFDRLYDEAKKKKKQLEYNVRDAFDANTARDQQKRIAAGQPRMYQQQTQQQRDKIPGFQLGNNSVTRGASRVIDQANMYDNGRTYKQRTPTTNLSSQQQTQRTWSNTARGAGLRGRRTAIGFGQAASGLYDLATPGTGTNRVSKNLDRYAKNVDQQAKRSGVNTSYQATAPIFELLAGGGIGAATKQGIKQAPKIIQKGAQAYDRVLNKAADFVRKDAGVIGKTTAYGMRKGLTPEAVVADTAMSAKYIGEDASKGIEITPQRVAADVALGIVTGTGAPIAGDLAKRGVKKAAPGVVKASQNVKKARSVAINREAEDRGAEALRRSLQAERQRIAGQINSLPPTPNNAAIVSSLLSKQDRIDAQLKSVQGAQRTGMQKVTDKLLTGQPGMTVGGPNALQYMYAKKHGRVFDGVDGKPRFEIDDSAARIANPQGKTLGEVLDHPELYKNYPELANTPVLPENNPTLKGSYGGGVMRVNQLFDDASKRKTILHETQHAVQEKEKFSTGGDAPDLTNPFSKASQDFRDYVNTPKGKEHFRKLVLDEVSNDPALTDTQAMNLASHKMKREYGNTQYRRLAGEAEARAVESRADLPMSKRYVIDKSDTPDTKSLKREIAELDRKINAFDGDSPAKQKLIDRQIRAVEELEGGKTLKTDSPLHAEARKYKSADEFIASRGNPLYHGSDKTFDEMKVGQPTKRRMMMDEYETTSNGAFFTPDKNVAREYGQNVGEYYVDAKNPLDFRDRKNDAIFDEFDRSIANDDTIDLKPGDGGFSEWMYLDGELGKKFAKFVKSKGFDSLKLRETSEFTGDDFDSIVALDNNQIKNRKQLEDTYNEANSAPSPTKRSTFYDSLDVPKDELIVRNGDGVAMSIDKRNYADDLSPEQNKAIVEYAEFLKDVGQGNGVDILPDGRRVSNNFRAGENKGKDMTNTDWFDQARKDLESGKADDYAVEEYRKLSRQKAEDDFIPKLPEEATATSPSTTPAPESTYFSRRDASKLNPNELPSLHPENISTMKAPNGVDLEPYSMTHPDNFKHLSKKVEYDDATKQLTVYRVVPDSANSVEAGDFVFDNRAAAEAYMAKYPNRGNKIVTAKGRFDDFLSPDAIQSREKSPKGTGELIYAPQALRGKPLTSPVKSTTQPPVSPDAAAPAQPPVARDTGAVSSLPDSTKPSRFANRTVQNSDEVSPQLKGMVKDEQVQYTPTTNEGRLQQAEQSLAGKSDEDNFSSVLAGLKKGVADEAGQNKVTAIAFAKKLDEAGDEDSLFKATEIYHELSQRLSEAGQEVQAAALLASRTPEGLRFKAQRDLEEGLGRKLNPAEQKELKSLTDTVKTTEQVRKAAQDKLDRLMTRLKSGKATDETVLQNNIEKAQDALRRAEEDAAIARDNVQYHVASKVPNSTSEKVVNFWRAGLLTAPTTTGGAAVGNAAMTLGRKLWINPAATMADMALSVLNGGRRTKTLAKRGEWAKGARAGTKNATSKQFWKTGYDPMNPRLNQDNSVTGSGATSRVVNYGGGRIDRMTGGRLGQATGAYVNGVYKLMGAADQPFRYAAHAESLSSMAKAEAINQKIPFNQRDQWVQNFIDNPPDWAKEQVGRESMDSTFQNETAMARVIQKAKSVRKDGNHVTAAILDFVAPFAGVPSAVADRAVRYTGLKAAKEIVKVARRAKGERLSPEQQRDLAKYLAEGTIGLPFVAAGYALAQNGLFTGAYPTDKKEQELWRSKRMQENSVKIGDRWYSMNYIQPFGVLMALGAGMANTEGENGENPALDDYLKNGGMGAIQSFMGQSYLEGLQGPLEAFNDPEQNLERYIASAASSFVPNFARSFARATDTVERETKGIVAGVKGAIPGLRQSLPEKQDMFGQSIPNKDNFVNMYANPLKPSKERGDATVAELERLFKGGEGILPTKAAKATFKSSGISLDDKQMREINALAGPAMKEKYAELIQSAEYQNLSDEDKRKALSKVNDTVFGALKNKYAADNQIGPYGQDGKGAKLTKDQKGYLQDGSVSALTSASIAKDVTPDNRKLLTEYDTLSSEERKAKAYTENDYDYKVAVAKLENDMKSGKLSKAQEVKRKNAVDKALVGKNYSKDARDLYGLSKGDIYDLITNDPNGQKYADELLAYDRELYDKGLTSTLKFKYGFATASKGGGGGGGRKGTGGWTGTGLKPSDFKTPYDNLIQSSTKGAQLARNAKLVKRKA